MKKSLIWKLVEQYEEDKLSDEMVVIVSSGLGELVGTFIATKSMTSMLSQCNKKPESFWFMRYENGKATKL